MAIVGWRCRLNGFSKVILHPGVQELAEKPASLVEVSRVDSFHNGKFPTFHFFLKVIFSIQRNIILSYSPIV